MISIDERVAFWREGCTPITTLSVQAPTLWNIRRTHVQQTIIETLQKFAYLTPPTGSPSAYYYHAFEKT